MPDQTKIVAGRDYLVYAKAFHATNTLPLDATLWGVAWGTPAGQSGAWVEKGYTVGGLRFSFGVTRTDIRVDQELDPVLRIATGRDLRLTTNLAEITPANLADASGMGAVTAGGGFVDFDIGSAVSEQYKSVGFDIRTPGDGLAFRVIGYRTLTIGNPEVAITPEAPAQIAFDVAPLPDTSAVPTRIIKIHDVG